MKKSCSENFERLEDGYFAGQSDNGRGGTSSAFFWRWLQRNGHFIYRFLVNKEPDENRIGVYSSKGHNHDGVNSRFIGNTVMAQMKAPFRTKVKFDVSDINAWTSQERWQKPIMMRQSTGNFSKNSPTLDRLFFGDGANRARVSILFALVNTQNGFWYPTTGALSFQASCVNTGHAVTLSGVSALNAAPFLKWVEITHDDPLQVSQNCMNGININVTQNGGGESAKVLVYGLVITEEHA